MGQNQVSLIERCPLFGGSFFRGFTVLFSVSVSYVHSECEWVPGVLVRPVQPCSCGTPPLWGRAGSPASGLPLVLPVTSTLWWGAGIHLQTNKHQRRVPRCQLYFAEVLYVHYGLPVWVLQNTVGPLLMRESANTSDVSLFQVVTLHARNCSWGGWKVSLLERCLVFWGVLSDF